jgi:two-component system sensor histidine kinase HydH
MNTAEKLRQVVDSPESLTAREERVTALLGAFEQFRRASERLEERYAVLKSETEQLRRQIREKDIAIKKAEKLATLGEAAAAIAHEVRNPLGAMKLLVSLIKEDVAGKPDTTVLVDQMGRSIESLEHVVTNILHFSAGKKLVLAPVNIHALVHECAEQLRAQSPHTLHVVTALEGNPFIRGAEHALRQIITNLCMNGVQAMKQHGTLTLVCKEVGDHTVLTVRDTGPGFPAAVRERLFEPFVTTKNEGTGLGLAIVKKIVDEHGASISIPEVPHGECCISFERVIGG